MATWASDYMVPIWEEYQKKGTKADPEQHRVFNIIFYGYTEITNTYEALRFSETLISVAPPRSQKIDRDQYLKYLINTFFQEVYILKERLNAYATKVKRLYERGGRKHEAQQHIDPIFENVKYVLDGLIKIRGHHVHSNRYSDDGLDWLSSLAFVAKHNTDFKSPFAVEFKAAQLKWSKQMKKVNEAIALLLDWYFEQLLNVVEEDGKVSIP